jgi:hypothetical protein
MITLETAQDIVTKAQQSKSDEIVSLASLNPKVIENSTSVIVQDDRLKMTETGESSLLQKIQIPVAFYRRSSESLKGDMINEHFWKNVKGSEKVLARKRNYGDNEMVRYIASDKYAIFDDTNVISSLSYIDGLADFKLNEFHQRDDYMIMRFTTPNPIEIPGSRPFYPGIQVSNSEIGKSSVKVAFLLWEEICTNGMTVMRDQYAAFNQKHIGRRSEQTLAEKVENFFGRIGNFQDAMYEKLVKTTGIKHELVMEKIEKDPRVPKKLKETLEAEYLPKYATSVEEANALDTLSAFTEAIQSYNWDSRMQYEQIAGDYMMSLS